MHTHDDHAPKVTARTSYILLALVALVIVGVAAGAFATWPSNHAVLGSQQFLADGAEWRTATIVGYDEATGEMTVRVDETYVDQIVPPTGLPGMDVEPGERIRVVELSTGELIFSDFERSQPLRLLLIGYVLVVLLVARWKGLGALLGLVLAFGVVVFYTVPALLGGASPLVVGLVTGAGALAFLLYVAHGFSARTTTAYLGTVAGLLVTAVIGSWAVGAARIPGVPAEDLVNVRCRPVKDRSAHRGRSPVL